MGCIILCHEKKANKPYYLEDVHLNIYTIEELCFYLCNNLYLLNKSIMNKELCTWLDEELDMTFLSSSLLAALPSCSLSRFVVSILSSIGFCDEEELEEIQHTLQSLRDQSEEEQLKLKADNLLKNGKYEFAIREYDQILKKRQDDKLGNDFYGRIHHNLGVACAKQFLFREAAGEFLTAYQIAGKDEMLKEYLCACYMYMDDDEFQELIADNHVYENVASRMRNEFNEQDRQYRFFLEQKQYERRSTKKMIEEIKEEYRKSLI